MEANNVGLSFDEARVTLGEVVDQVMPEGVDENVRLDSGLCRKSIHQGEQLSMAVGSQGGVRTAGVKLTLVQDRVDRFQPESVLYQSETICEDDALHDSDFHTFVRVPAVAVSAREDKLELFPFGLARHGPNLVEGHLFSQGIGRQT